MTPKESRYTFLAGVAVAIAAALLVELDPHHILTSEYEKFRPLLAASLFFFTGSIWCLFKAAEKASVAAEQRVDLNYDRRGSEFDREHHVDILGFLGAAFLGSAILALIVDRWIQNLP